MTELQKRILVAVIGIPIAIAFILLGSYYLLLVIVLLNYLATLEFAKLAKSSGFNSNIQFTSIMNTIFIVPWLLFVTDVPKLIDFSYAFIYAPFSIPLYYFIILTLLIFFIKENKLNTILTLSGSLFFVSIPFVSLFFIRNHDSRIIPENLAGYFMLIYFASIWIGDSMAYFIGRKVGKHKIAPSISPNKSWEGGIAGLIVAALAFYFGLEMVGLYFHNVILVLLIFTVSVLSQVGDFVESSIKREANIKDSSNLLSAHGGILDRMDGIMFTAPIVLIILLLSSFFN
jgi:phosphatidate cytidylyltransferase